MAFARTAIATIDKTQCGVADTANFVVMVILFDATLRNVANGGFVQDSNGYDIRPYADINLTIPLTYELVHYREVNSSGLGGVYMFIQLPNLSVSTNTQFFLAYGNPALTTDGSSTSTWDSNYKGVWHLEDTGVVTPPNLNDATSNGNNGTNHGVTQSNGPIGASVHFTNASGQYADMGNGASLSITGAITLEAWIYIDSIVSFQRVMGRYDVVAALGYSMYYGASNFFFSMYDGVAERQLASLTALSTGSFYHIGGTVDASKNAAVYLNGVQDNTGTLAAFAASTSEPFLLGARDDFAANRFHDGILDEVRVSNTNRSASYFAATYNNTKPGSTFISWQLRRFLLVRR